LQLGVRYDALPHAWERQNYLGNFNQASYVGGAAAAPIWDASGAIDAASPSLYTFNGIPSYINGTNLAGINHYPVGVVTNDYNTIQPRVGFSEDMFGNGKTILRGGFGTFYERMQGNDVFGVATSAPFNPSLSLGSNYFSNPGKNWNTGAVIQPNALIFAGSAYSLAQAYKAPAVAQFSLGVQRELAPSVVAVVQYVGNIAWHQNVQAHVNNLAPNVGIVNVADPTKAAVLRDARCVFGDGGNKYPGGVDGSCTVGSNNYGGMNAFRQFPGYADITQSQNSTNGTYNGFQAGVRVQNKWGLSGELDYTYSHEIDLTSYDLTTVSNPWYNKYDKGSGALDRRQMLSANYIYKLPIFNKSKGLVHSVAGGWEVAGTFIDESGTPSVIGESINYDPVGLGGGYTVRPNATAGKMTYPKKRLQWFDTSKFSAPVASWLGGPNMGFGNAGKDAIVGPGRVNFTTSLYKSFAITESARFEMRFESFNTFNHTEWNGLGTGMSCGNNTGLPGTGACQPSGNYGQVTGTQDPRALELGGKFIF
jgi:hypothetical protein